MRFFKSREIIGVLLNDSKKKKKSCTAGVHSVVCETIWFKLGVMKDSIDLYIFVLVTVNLTFIQGHRDARDLKLLCQLSPYLAKFLVDLDGI